MLIEPRKSIVRIESCQVQTVIPQVLLEVIVHCSIEHRINGRIRVGKILRTSECWQVPDFVYPLRLVSGLVFIHDRHYPKWSMTENERPDEPENAASNNSLVLVRSRVVVNLLRTPRYHAHLANDQDAKDDEMDERDEVGSDKVHDRRPQTELVGEFGFVDHRASCFVDKDNGADHNLQLAICNDAVRDPIRY